MSITSIDAIQPGRRVAQTFMPELFAGFPQPESRPAAANLSQLQQLISALVVALETAARSLGGANGMGGHAPGGAPPGGTDPAASAGGAGMPGMPGMGAGGSRAMLDGLASLMDSLASMFQSTQGKPTQPNDTARSVAGKLCDAPGLLDDVPPPPPPKPPATEPNAPSRPTAEPGEIPPATGTVIVDKPIVVKAGETFDGGGKLFKAGSAIGDGSQNENQKPVFVLEPGATLKNVQVDGGDGVHTRGDATLKDVWWKNVGEDAMTMKGPGNVKVIGGGAYDAADKVFQINAPGSLSIEGFTADTFGKAVRTNGGKEFPIDISIKDSTFRNGEEAIVRTDAKQARIQLDNVRHDGSVEHDVIAPPEAEVTGAASRGSKQFKAD